MHAEALSRATPRTFASLTSKLSARAGAVLGAGVLLLAGCAREATPREAESGPGDLVIVYTSQVAQVNSLHIMNADGSGERVLRPPDPPAESAVFSPDGHKIAYIAGKPAQVFVTDSDLKSARPLTKAVAAESHINESVALAFSPDGKTVAYVESATGGSSIYVVDATGGEPRQLMAPFGASEAPVSVPPLRVVFTPDSRAVVYDRLAKADFGQRLVFATIADVVQGDKTDELTVPVPEGVIATREDFRGVPAQLGYSRDGKKIVYQLSVSRGRNALFVADANFTNPRKLADLKDPRAEWTLPTFSPDGTQIAYTDTLFDVGAQAIFVVNADGSGVRQVSKPQRGDYHTSPSWGYAARHN